MGQAAWNRSSPAERDSYKVDVDGSTPSGSTGELKTFIYFKPLKTYRVAVLSGSTFVASAPQCRHVIFNILFQRPDDFLLRKMKE